MSDNITKVDNVYSSVEVKECLDSNLKTYLLSHKKYKEIFQIQDTKIAINILLVVVAALSFYIDKFYNFNKTVSYQIALIACYTLLTIGYWCFSSFIEDGCFFQGQLTSGDNHRINVKSSVNTEITTIDPNASPLYNLEITIVPTDQKKKKNNNNNKNLVKSKIEFTKLFTKDGVLQVKVFQDFINETTSKKID